MGSVSHCVSRMAMAVVGWVKAGWWSLCFLFSLLKKTARVYVGKPDLEEAISSGDAKGIVVSLMAGQTLFLSDEMFRDRFLFASEAIHKAVWLLGVPARRRGAFLQDIRKWIKGVKDGTIPAMLRRPSFPSATWDARWSTRAQRAEAMLARFEGTPETLPQVREADLERLLGTAQLLDAGSLKTMIRGIFTVEERIALFSLLNRRFRRNVGAEIRKEMAFALLA